MRKPVFVVSDLGFRKKKEVAKTKALIKSYCAAVIAQLICAFVFAYAKSRFSHDVSFYHCSPIMNFTLIN